MTEEDAKNYLMRVQYSPRDIALLDEEYRWACNGIERIKALWSCACPPSALAAVERYAKRIAAKRNVLLRLQKEAAARIDRVPDARLRDILSMRYLQGEELKTIASALCYEARYVARLHKKALAAFADAEH